MTTIEEYQQLRNTAFRLQQEVAECRGALTAEQQREQDLLKEAEEKYGASSLESLRALIDHRQSELDQIIFELSQKLAPRE